MLISTLHHCCDHDIYKKGTPVLALQSISPFDLNFWTHKIANLSGAKVDWHYCGQTAVIKAIGNIQSVLFVIRRVLMSKNELHKHCIFPLTNKVSCSYE